MKSTGIHYVFDNVQAAVRETMAGQLGREAGKAFEALDPHLSQMIGKYGIGEDEWDLLRAVPDLTRSEGRTYMTPRDAMRVDPGEVETLLRDRGEITAATPPDVAATLVQRFTTGLSDKLLSFYGDAADHAAMTPVVKERAVLLGATRPGSVAGETMRFLTQFKMWPAAALSQVIGREIYMSLSAKEATANLFTLAAISAAFGYMRMSVNDAALGNPLEPATMLAGLPGRRAWHPRRRPVRRDEPHGRRPDQHHGRLGRERRRHAGEALRPVPGRRDGPERAPQERHHRLHAVLPPLRSASPGWWERTNRRLVKEQGRAMTGYTPSGGVPYGVPWLSMQDRQGQSSGLLGTNR